MKRRPLTNAQLFELFGAQHGKCTCGTILIVGPKGQHTNFIDEHIQPISRGGTNDLANRRLNCIECAKRKTFHPRSLATTLGGDNFEAKKAARIARGGKKSRHPMKPTGRKIPSRPWR